MLNYMCIQMTWGIRVTLLKKEGIYEFESST